MQRFRFSLRCIPTIARLRAQGRGWKAIAREMKLGVGTVLRAAQQVAKPSSEDPDDPLLAN